MEISPLATRLAAKGLVRVPSTPESSPEKTPEASTEKSTPVDDYVSLASIQFNSTPEPNPPSRRALSELAARQASSVAGQAIGGAVGGVAAEAIFEGLKTGFVKSYVDPSATLEQCKALVAKYPDLVELVELPIKSYGYDGKRKDLRGAAPFYYLRLGPKTPDREQKLGVFQHAAPHAREHINPMTMLELAEQLCANYDPNSDEPAVLANTRLMDELDIFIAPQTNPDGTNFSFYDDKGWRKNRAPFDGVDTGVDINRNYPYKWKGSKTGNYQTYPGKGPASEPETQAIISVVDRHPNIRFVVDWHSYSEDIRRPLGVSQRDNAIYDEFHNRMKSAIASSRGREYDTIVSQVVEGSSDDYWYHERGLFSTVVETGRSFQPSVDEAVKVAQEASRGAREVLEFASDYSRRFGLEKAQPIA